MRAARSGSVEHKWVAFRIARSARLVATGRLRTNSWVPPDDTTEILRPGPVEAAVDDHMADLLLAQLLRYRGKADQCVDLSLGEHLRRLRHRMRDEFDV